jgi:alpha-L-fucosidase
MGTATADSEQTNPAHPASHGNDGLTSTRWCAANSSTGHYWTLDLGAVHPLVRFEVIWEYPAAAVGLPYGYVVSVSNDGMTFTSAIDRSTTTSTMQIQSSDFASGASGRYVRVTVNSLPTGAWASFFEARVFGQ